jgi:hypothetical protein
MANIVADPTATCHGILHSVTEKEFAVLKEVESNYETVQVPVTPYKPSSSSSAGTRLCQTTHDPAPAAPAPAADDTCSNTTPSVATAASPALTPSIQAPAVLAADPKSTQQPAAVPGTPITATAFIVQPAAIAAMLQEHPEWANALPSDRYIRIIVAGLKHYGADTAWIDWISAQPCRHGRQPHEYLKFPAAHDTSQQNSSGQQQLADGQQGQQGVRTQADLPVFTMQQLSQHEGQLVDNKTILAVGPKVVEMDISCKPTTPFANIIQKHFAGKQVGDGV